MIMVERLNSRDVKLFCIHNGNADSFLRAVVAVRDYTQASGCQSRKHESLRDVGDLRPGNT